MCGHVLISFQYPNPDACVCIGCGVLFTKQVARHLNGATVFEDDGGWELFPSTDMIRINIKRKDGTENTDYVKQQILKVITKNRSN